MKRNRMKPLYKPKKKARRVDKSVYNKRKASDGFDYTLLYNYLIKCVGRPWNEVFREIKPRLNYLDPIWKLVVDPTTCQAWGGVHVYEHVAKIYTLLYINEKGYLALLEQDLVKLRRIYQNLKGVSMTFMINGKTARNHTVCSNNKTRHRTYIKNKKK